MTTAFIVGGGAISGSTPIVFDATLSVTPRYKNTVTKHPVETGSTVSDHVYKENIEIEISGMITNSSIGNIFRDDYRFNRVQTIHDLLVALRENREFITVSSQLSTFSNCIITSLSLPRTAQIGDALQVTMTLEQLQLVQSDFVTVSLEIEDAARRKKNAGQKTGLDSNNPNNSEEDKSLLERSRAWIELTRSP